MSTDPKIIKIGERYACTVCDKTFPRKWNANNHLRVHEQRRRKAKCPIRKCKKTFFDIPNVRLHFSRFHSDESFDDAVAKLKWKNVERKVTDQMPECRICFKRFTRKENLAYHLHSYHSKNRTVAEFKKNDERVFQKIRINHYLSTKKSVLKKDTSKCNCIDDTCGVECINRSMLYECEANCSKNCTNKTIQTSIPHSFEVFITRDKGWGVRANAYIESGSFIIQYVGDVISEHEFKNRLNTQYSSDVHHYGIYLEAGFVVDARDMGNESRFVNHSCWPNCEIQKWIVKGLPCVAIFSLRSISPGEELTIDYKFQSYNDLERKTCKCNATNCSGIFGKKVSSRVYKYSYIF